MSVKTRRQLRERRHLRVRSKVAGTPERPRLCVQRTLSHIYAQLIDDAQGRTLVSASTLSEEVKKEISAVLKKATKGQGGNKAAAETVGRVLAEKAMKAGIKKVVFDRGGYRYHGRVLALADSARKGGLSF